MVRNGCMLFTQLGPGGIGKGPVGDIQRFTLKITSSQRKKAGCMLRRFDRSLDMRSPKSYE